jgi:hypothetical protein
MIISIESWKWTLLSLAIACLFPVLWWISTVLLGGVLFAFVDIIVGSIAMVGWLFVHEAIHILMIHILGGQVEIFAITSDSYEVWQDDDWPVDTQWREVAVAIAPFLVTMVMVPIVFVLGYPFTAFILGMQAFACYSDLREIYQRLCGQFPWYKIPFD